MNNFERTKLILEQEEPLEEASYMEIMGMQYVIQGMVEAVGVETALWALLGYAVGGLGTAWAISSQWGNKMMDKAMVDVTWDGLKKAISSFLPNRKLSNLGKDYDREKLISLANDAKSHLEGRFKPQITNLTARAMTLLKKGDYKEAGRAIQEIKDRMDPNNPKWGDRVKP